MRGAVEKRVAALVRELPPLDETVGRLLRAASADPADRDALAVAVARDSGVCATLLFLANCGCFGTDQKMLPAETIAEALAQVDVDTLAMMVGASSALRSVEAGVRLPAKQWSEYVRHSREIAVCCGLLAELVGLPFHGREFFTTAGLTHDIGRVVIMVAANNRTASLLGTSPAEMLQVVGSEQAAYGLDHCHLGHALFCKWGFSEPLQQGILRHHSPLVGGDFCFPGAVIFAAHFVTMSDFTGEIITRMFSPVLLRRMGLKAADFDRARELYALRADAICGAEKR